MKNKETRVTDLNKYKENRKAASVAKNIRRGLLVLVLFFMAFGLYVYRNDLTDGSVRSMLSEFDLKGVLNKDIPKEISFNSDTSNCYAVYDKTFVVASSDGITFYSEDDEPLFVSMPCDAPTIEFQSGYLLFYDLGGNILKLFNGKEVVCDNTYDYPILSADVGKGGLIAAATEERGYKGVVTVMDENMNKLFVWSSAERYVSKPAISPNGKNILVSSVTTNEGQINGNVLFFRLNKDEIMAEDSFGNQIILDVAYKDNNLAQAITDCGLYIFNGKGELKQKYDFEGRHLSHFNLTPKRYNLLVLSQSKLGGGANIEIINNRGEKVYEYPISGDIISIDANNSRIAILTRTGLLIFNNKLELLEQKEISNEIRKIMLTNDGNIYLLSPARAELIDIP